LLKGTSFGVRRHRAGLIEIATQVRQEVESSQLGFRQEVGPDDLPLVDPHLGSSVLGKDAFKEVAMVLSSVLDEEDLPLRAQLFRV
jgi:hypothetical protein